MKILVRKQSKKINMHKKKLYLNWVEMGHHALALGRLSLLVGGAMSQMGMDVEERECGWVGRQSSQSIHGQHNNRQGRSALRVTPHPSFIVFPRDFMVLSPWLL